MISLPSAVRAFFCTRSVNMRKSFDGLSGLVEECFRQDLLDGHLLMSPSLAPSLGTRFLAHLLVLSGLCPEWRRQLGGGHLAAM